jgi:hypothetical protein
MTASSSYSGTVDNFWSRGDIRVHTFGGFAPRPLKSSLRDLFEGKPTRTAGAKRRGAEAARQPVSADVSSRRKTRLSRLGARARIRTPRRARRGTPHPHGSLTPSCANYVAVNKHEGPRNQRHPDQARLSTGNGTTPCAPNHDTPSQIRLIHHGLSTAGRSGSRRRGPTRIPS